MRLKRIHITRSKFERNILDNFNQYLSPNLNTNERADIICLVGKNGTGKSQLLETLAEIFFFLDKKFRHFEPDSKLTSNIFFELEYHLWLDGHYQEIFISNNIYNKKHETRIYKTENKERIKILDNEVQEYLPKHVIGYTSGENETLSMPFRNTNYEYSDYVKNLGLKPEEQEYDKVPTTRLIFPDYTSNFGIFVANYLLASNNLLDTFEREELIQLKSLRSFRIIFRKRYKGKKEVGLTKELEESIQNLVTCASAYNIEDGIYTLDYYVNDATKAAFKHYFKDSFTLYMVFYKLGLLNSLLIPKKEISRVRKLQKEGNPEKLPTIANPDKIFLITEIKLNIKNVKSYIDYQGLSDGQHQFLHVFGMMMMIDMNNVLFLLDEPETHFNPSWRSNFIKILNDITKGRKQDYMTTTHSPFILSDSKQEKIFIFRSDGTITHPEKETYGATVEDLLREAFDIPVAISKASLDAIRKLRESNDLEQMEEQQHDFADSIEKFYLKRKIRKLNKED
jgi:restriction system-associated AAA family ATPase